MWEKMIDRDYIWQVFNNVQEDSSWRLGDTDEEGKIIVQQPEGDRRNIPLLGNKW